MASNFVYNIEDDSEDEFWIVASCVSVLKPRRPIIIIIIIIITTDNKADVM